MTQSMLTAVLWDVMPCSSQVSANIVWELAGFVFIFAVEREAPRTL